MQSTAQIPPINACLVSRDIADFALLIEDMDKVWGRRWGELTPSEAKIFLNQSDARHLDVLVITADEDDRDKLEVLEQLMAQAALLKLPTLLVAEDLTATEIYYLMRHGGAEYIAYPLAADALEKSISTLAPKKTQPLFVERKSRKADGQVIAVQGLNGGTGSTTLAVNLANELSLTTDGSICLVDLDLQFGSIATHLDLKVDDASLNLWSDVEGVAHQDLDRALTRVEENFHVLPAPSQIVPMDFFDREGLQGLLGILQQRFDHVIIDLPKSLQSWTEAVFDVATSIICPLHLDMRSTEAARRYCSTIVAEDLPFEKIRFAINRAPAATDVAGRSQINRLGTLLHSQIDILLPEGGQIVSQLGDQGLCLAEADTENPLRNAIHALAQTMVLGELSEQKAA